MLQGLPLLAVTFSLVYVLRLLLNWWNGVRSIGNMPGYRTLFSQYGMVARILPRLTFINPGGNHFFEDKHSSFKAAGWDMVSVVSALPSTMITVNIADADTAQEVIASRAHFPKPIKQYRALTFFGHNIVASEDEEWKKYRKITAPAFSDRNNKLVWDETVKIVQGLFADVWHDKDVITVDHAVDITLPVAFLSAFLYTKSAYSVQIALFVIGVAGFGRDMSWRDDDLVPPGHLMTFKDSLHIASLDVFFKVFLPDWALVRLGQRTKNVKTAFDELEKYMKEMIHDRQTSEKVERYDLFSSLLAANNDDLESVRLADSELIGNIFIFLVAGHETTAHTLCFTFALLALYPDEQEKLFQQIKSLLPEDRLPTYEEMPLYKYSMAVFYETLRLFPPVVNIPKVSAEDTVLTVGNAFGEKKTFPIPKDTRVSINVPGLHYNPRYWDEPEAFKPERFLKPDWPRDAFIPFSAGEFLIDFCALHFVTHSSTLLGVRSCLGRKFFETEGIAVLTLLVSKFKITIKDEPEFAGETFEQRKERVLRNTNRLTLTPTRVPLTFTRRV
ncbi:hypothetical protein CVT26_007295 [Gymnopilus dilepis]|uniref:Cytochrome P450 n=1 Tax=Gymnopilus dilepis TaxID=231916 RepID=A0A409VLT0_9AGAR|nr:hypothetical protein CVT26_007295 [Gymnopilus dilepis]